MTDMRVLVADDDPAMRALMKKYLEAAGYEVLQAANGRQALEILHRQGPALVLSDWQMPEMTGVDLCRAIRASETVGFVYLIILTANSDKDSIVEALEAGANDFLTKPCHREELLARINAGGRIVCLEADLSRQQRELHRVNADLAVLNERLEQMASTDELTGLANRRSALGRLKEEWELSIRHGTPLGCIMADLDHFKQCNDRYGHDIGDLVLKETAAILTRAARIGETIARLGGEEILVICPNSIAETTLHAAERLREAVEQHVITTDQGPVSVTLSLGVAEREPDMAGPEVMLRRADEAMYAAKANGRNRVELAHSGHAVLSS